MARAVFTFILVVVVLALVAAGFYVLWTDGQFLSPQELAPWLTYQSEALGLTFDYPPEYEVEEALGDLSIRPKYPSQAQLTGLMPIQVKVEPLGTSTFTAYADELEANLLTNLAWQQHQSEIEAINNQVAVGALTTMEARSRLVALEQQIAEEILAASDRYAFNRQVMGGFPAVWHWREVYTRTGRAQELYLDGGDQIIIFSTETTPALAERIFNSIKKI